MANPTPYRYVGSRAELRAVVAALAAEPRFALDTEFHRERTYRPQAALIQIAWPGDLVLIDPLAVDVEALAEVFASGALMVAHAAAQDLEVLEDCCGMAPPRIFDTQIAAGFLGLGTPALSALYESEIGWRPPKGDRLTDWLARPLKASQLDYAAGDVMHLLEIHDRLSGRLQQTGRSGWAEAEFELLLERNRARQKPEDAWTRLKEAKHLRRRDLPVVRQLAAWRERHAAKINHPVRHVLSDVAVVSIAQAAPRSVEQLAAVRGVSAGTARGRLGGAILGAVAEGLESKWSPPPRRATRSDMMDRLRPVVGLAATWVNQLARDHKIEPSLLATRADIEALIRGDAEARLTQGWRSEMAGEPLRRLMAGEAALAFDEGRIVLEERSGKPAD
ncbi:MAG: HRDC domain-containing protein [Acidimicrobiaceae bacterium]|nr:HRDC domain-containing protein [Acidimicrobiaceae bacterium]MCY4280841.1 HRDC domain-containing protein [Acidimicrobiaceae bacterium]MCY4295092.1 HRDC domain-containing protein [Acidimicrobiaceae bacterium]